MAQFDKYLNQAYGFQLEYPKSWCKAENIGGSVVSFQPDQDVSTHNPCLNVVVQDLSTPNGNTQSLDDFTKISLEQIQMMLPNIEDMRLVQRSLSGCEGKRVEYLTTLQGVQLKFLQVFTLKDNIAYIITFSSPVIEHNAHSKTIESCLESFQIIQRRGTPSLSLVSYYNPYFSYAIRVPRTWEHKELQGPPVVAFEFKETEQDKPVITFIVTAWKVGELKLSEYTYLLQEQVLENSSPKSQPKILTTTLGGFEANKTSFYSDTLQTPGHYDLVWTVQNGHAGILTFIHSISEDNPDKDLYSVMFDRIIDSFQFVDKQPTDNTIRYENLPQKFAIHYPLGYIQQEGFMGSTVSFSKNEKINFPPNINIVVQDMGSQPMTLEDFCGLLKQQIEVSVQNCDMVSEKDLSIGGGRGREFIYSGEVSGEHVKFVQRVVVTHNSKAAVVSFTSDQQTFDKEYLIAEPCLSTFTFI